MIEHVTVIVGLPGSGKTSLAHSYEGVTVLDDFSLMMMDDSEAALSVLTGAGTPHVVITDVNGALSTSERMREFLHKHLGDVEVSIIAFENDPDAAWTNVCRRDDGRPITRAAINSLSRIYSPEMFSQDIRPIYRP